MNYIFLIHLLFAVLNYFMLFYFIYKFNCDNINLYKARISKVFQPILYNKHRKYQKVEIGLLIYEDYCHIFLFLMIIEFFLYCLFNFCPFNFLILFIIFMSSGLFMGMYMIISDIRNKKKH